MINSIDSWKGFIKSEEVLITFSPSLSSFDSELSCTYDVPPPPSFSWEEVGSILMGIYRHSPELASKYGSCSLSTDTPCLADTPSHATVAYFSASQQSQSYSGFPEEEEEEDVDDDEREPASIYSEPPIQRLLVPPIKICLTEKKKKKKDTKDNTKNTSIFRVSAEEFIRALNSKGRMDLHFCFCWATKRPLSTKAAKRLEEAAWMHDDFVLLAEGLRGGEEAAKRATENLFRAAERSLEGSCLREDKKNDRELERALLCVSGCSRSDVRARALNLLEMLYNTHSMKFCAEEKPAFLCVGDKMDIYLDSIDEKKPQGSLLYVQVFFRGAVSWHRLWGCTGPKIKFTLAHTVKHPGFYDWRLVSYDVEQGGGVRETLQRGRFVVLPAPKEDLRTYKACSFLRPKFSGDRASFTVSTDKQSSGDEDLCVVNFPLSVSVLSWNSRYRKHISFRCERGDKSSVPTYSVAQSAETGCAILNYRMPETVDLLLSELRSWLERTGERPPKRVAVVFQGDWPFLCAASADEMARRDEDGSFHHADAEAALESPLVNQVEVVRMEAESGANVILSKVAQTVWRTYPNAALCIETSDPEQCDKALRSGFIPVDRVVEAMFAPSPEKGAYGRAKAHIPARGCAPAVVRIPPDAHKVSPFARTLAQHGFVYVLGKALAPESYLFEDEVNEKEEEAEREKDSAAVSEHRVYPVEWRGLDGRNEQRIVSFAVRHRGRVVLAAFMPEGSGGVTAEPVFGSELSVLMPSVLRMSSAARRGALLLVPPQHMTRGELCNEHHFTDFIPGNDGIQVWTIAPSACPDEVLYESSVYRLAGLVDKGISPAGNMVYDLLQEAAAKRGTDAGRLLLERLAAAIPRSVDRVFGNVLSRLFYVTHELPLCLLSTLRAGCAEMLRGGELGAVVFVSSEMGRFSTVGGVGVLVDELTRSIARQGYRVYVVTPYFNYNKYGHTDYLRPEDGFSYVGNVTVGIGDWERQDFGIHVGKENGVNLVFLHNYTYFPTPYSGETPEYKLRSVVALSKAALQACIFLNIKPSM